MSDEPPDDAPLDPGREPITRADLDAALRFVHALGMISRQELIGLTAKVEALSTALAGAGVIHGDAVDEAARRRADDRAVDERANGVVVRVHHEPDKYALTSLPDIPCDELMPLCQGRCCSFLFHLSFQDLDEGVVRWDYERPYQIRSGPDGRCTHQTTPGGCDVYTKRPAICRTYDCRADPRVWLDYERRIPAPLPPHVVPLEALARRRRPTTR